MSLTTASLDKKTVTRFVSMLLVVGGIFSFFSLGQLEDPEFTIKTAAIATAYPGASPEEVELEITDLIELAIQEMPQLDFIESISRAGVSIIKVNILKTYDSSEMPQIWDEVRKKVRDVTPSLPPGAGVPIVSDDFGDTYGFVLALTGEGYSYAELELYAKDLKKELSLVDGVARVEFWGLQNKVIYLDVSETQLAELGISPSTIAQTLQNQNVVVDAGHINIQGQRLRFETTGTFINPEDIGDLLIRAIPVSEQITAGNSRNGELLRLGDIATVRRGYQEPAATVMRYDGLPSLALSISNISGGNIVDLGTALDQRISELSADLPIGIEIHKFAWQSDLVAKAISDFMISLMEAIAIVLVVLAIFMGWRMGAIIGAGLVMTILGTFMVMSLWGIDMQRMSLGALVIALGMMVDNAIVVADGIYVRLQQGMDRRQAAEEATSSTSLPLLGATVIAVMAFYPIYASPDSTGEYCASLFQVVAAALLISWVLSMTTTPLHCIAFLPDPKPKAEGEEVEEAYSGKFYDRFRGLLRICIGKRWLSLGVASGMLVAAVIGFGFVSQLFFPDAARAQFMIDYWAPEGTRIEQVSDDISRMENLLLADERVAGLGAFIGAGPPRFYLPVEPEGNYPGYAQLIVNTVDIASVSPMVSEYESLLKDQFPEARVRVRKYGAGPSTTYKFEARFGGPAEADPETLLALGEQGLDILRDHPLVKDNESRTDWRQPVQKVRIDFDQERGRWAGTSRVDIARATKRSFDGIPVGYFREGDDLWPIVVRNQDADRRNISNLGNLQTLSPLSTSTVPLAQVVNDIAVEWEYPIIARRDRRRTVTVQAEPHNATAPELMATVQSQFEAIELPPGFTMEWGGEFESTADSQAALLPGILPAIAIILLIIVMLFDDFRPLAVILGIIPFMLIGITVGLLVFDTPFGFVALLGAMSLAGMMIKNAIVLLDSINQNLAEGNSPYDAVINAAVARLRPVLLAAATTVLGVIPLLGDVFWVGMAVTVMAGLTFGSILTMILVPVLYSIIYKVHPGDQPAPSAPVVDSTMEPALA